MSSDGTIRCPGCGAKVAQTAASAGAKCEYCGTSLPAPAGFPPAAFAPPGTPYQGMPGGGTPYGAPGGAPYGSPGGPSYGAPPGYGGAQAPQFPVPAFAVPQRARPKRKSAAKIIIFVVLGVLVAGAIAFFVWYTSWSRVEGRIESTGGALGTWSTSLSSCHSGDAFAPDFFGADLRADSPRAHVQVQGGDESATVVVGGPQGEQPHLDLTKDVCAKFDVFVEWGNAEVNDVKTVQGHLHLDCSLPDGGRVKLDADFEACH